MKKSKMSEVNIFKDNILERKRPAPVKSKAYIVKSFRLPSDMVNKLKEYTKTIAPSHLKITESDVIRYMIDNLDLKKAREEFFKLK